MNHAKIILGLSLCFITLFSSCKKENSATDPEEAIVATYEISTDNAVNDFMTEDDNDVMSEAAEDNGILGNFAPDPLESNNFLACATVTVTPQSGFPKTMTIRFDSTCTTPRGIVRKGIIRIVFSDFLRNPGSTAIMTFDGYYVNGFKREGKITWTNTSTSTTRSWQRKVENGKITAPGGRYWLHESVKEVTQVAGVSTPRNFLDDEFSITGHSSVTNARGISRTATIVLPLHKKYTCRWIDKGRIKFQGPNHFAILDYGNGTCDNEAVISIDGRPPRTIILP
jgi:hypothetical protein